MIDSSFLWRTGLLIGLGPTFKSRSGLGYVVESRTGSTVGLLVELKPYYNDYFRKLIFNLHNRHFRNQHKSLFIIQTILLRIAFCKSKIKSNNQIRNPNSPIYTPNRNNLQSNNSQTTQCKVKLPKQFAAL